MRLTKTKGPETKSPSCLDPRVAPRQCDAQELLHLYNPAQSHYLVQSAVSACDISVIVVV